MKKFIRFILCALAVISFTGASAQDVQVGLLGGVGKDPEAMFKKLHDAGFKYCQIGFGTSWDKEMATTLKKLSKKYDVKISTMMYCTPGGRWNFLEGPTTIGLVPPVNRIKYIDTYKKAIDFCAMADIPAMHSHFGFIPEEPNCELYASFIECMRELCQYAKDKGVSITMEPYGDPLHAPFGRVAHFLYYTDQVEGLKMTLDTGNFIYADEDALDAEARLGHLVTHVHLKDYKADPEFAPRRFLRGKIASTIGGGYIPVWHILDRLAARGYDGYLTIEEFLVPDHRRAAEESVAFIKSFLNRNA